MLLVLTELKVLTVPQGPPGLAGANGTQGPPGLAGANGTNGINGTQGPPGTTRPCWS